MQQSTTYYCTCGGGGTSDSRYINTRVGGGYLRRTTTHGPTWQWQNHICIYRNWWVQQKQTSTRKMLEEMSQNHTTIKMFGEGLCHRKFNEGWGIWLLKSYICGVGGGGWQRGIYLQVWTSYHNTLQSTSYNSPMQEIYHRRQMQQS